MALITIHTTTANNGVWADVRDGQGRNLTNHCFRDNENVIFGAAAVAAAIANNAPYMYGPGYNDLRLIAWSVQQDRAVYTYTNGGPVTTADTEDSWAEKDYCVECATVTDGTLRYGDSYTWTCGACNAGHPVEPPAAFI